MNDQPTLQDILEAINASSSETQTQFDNVQTQFDKVQGQFVLIKETMATKQELRQLEQKIIDKMSEGFADMEGSLVVRQRKEDQKVNLILDLLERHKVAPIDEIDRVRNIRLFPTTPLVS